MDSDSKSPNIQPEVMRTSDERKGGALAVFLAKLGLGGGAGGAGAGLGTTASVATGGGLLASKAGVVALIVAGTSMAAGIVMLTRVEDPNRKVVGKAGGFLPQPGTDSAVGARAAADAALGQAQGVSADGVSGSLDYFNRSNKGAVADPAVQTADASAGEDSEWSDAASKGSGVKAPDHGKGGSGKGGSAKGSLKKRRKLAMNKGFGRPSGGSTSASVSASANLGGKTGRMSKGAKSGTMGAMSGSRSSRAGGRRSVGLRTKSLASAQLRSHGSTLRRNMGGGHTSSQGSGVVMDGGRGAGSIGGGAGGIGGGGVGTGGAGVDSAKPSANPTLDTKEVPDPAEAGGGEDNKTPYQTQINIALIGIGVWAVCMVALGILKKKIQAAIPTGTAGPLLMWAKIVAGIAILAGGVVAAMGMDIFGIDQMMGGMIGAVGAFLTADAAYRLYNLMSEDPPPKGATEEVAKKWTESNMGGLASMLKGIF